VSELHSPNEPLQLFETWYQEALETEPRVAEAMQLATVDERGRPTIRTVLMKSFSDNGMAFYTNFASRKASDIQHLPNVAACFHWKDLERQVIIEGSAVRLTRTEDEAYFATRDRGSQIGAWVSQQSKTLHDWAELEQAVTETSARFQGKNVPCPLFWGGYRLKPDSFEFWQGRRDRLHVRRVFERSQEGGWAQRLLWP
jgi:pyridoxamine 5'-phosphate oxidase